jgi:hypothetical protein
VADEFHSSWKVENLPLQPEAPIALSRRSRIEGPTKRETVEEIKAAEKKKGL